MKRILVLLLLVFSPSIAIAQNCTFSISSINFLNVNTLSSAPTDVTGSLVITCNNNVLLSTIRVCPGIGPGTGGADATSRRLAGPSTLNYQLYQNADRTVVWGSNSGNPPGATPPTIDVEMNAGGDGGRTVPIYGRVFGGQGSVGVGTYTSNFTAAQTDFFYAYVGVLPCPGIAALPKEAHPTFTVTATVVANCGISAQPLNFGTVGRLTVNVDATSRIDVTCTVDAPYSVGLSNGNTSGATPTTRKMGNLVTYGLYRDANRLQPWGGTIGSNTAAGTGNGSSQRLTVYGRVPPQTTPVAGTYSDLITATITY